MLGEALVLNTLEPKVASGLLDASAGLEGEAGRGTSWERLGSGRGAACGTRRGAEENTLQEGEIGEYKRQGKMAEVDVCRVW